MTQPYKDGDLSVERSRCPIFPSFDTNTFVSRKKILLKYYNDSKIYARFINFFFKKSI